MIILRIVIALLLFGLLILAHELGHFLVAKACGVRVNEFALGMGPKLLSFGKKETKYSLRLFPIGGFCAMEGEDEDSDDPKAFGNKKVWQRMLIVVAGVVMNFILGYVILLIGIGFFNPLTHGESLFGTTTIAGHAVEEASSYQTGLRTGDTIVSINGRPVITSNDIMVHLQSDEDGIVPIEVKRTVDGVEQTLLLPEVTFEIVEQDGVRQLIYDFQIIGEPQTFWNTFAQAGKTEVSLVTTTWSSLFDMVTGRYGLNELAGPVGTVDLVGNMVSNAVSTVQREDIYSVFILMALISVNLGVMNLLPIPALDGGRLLFLIVEAIIRRPIPKKFEGIVHLIGFALLILFMIIVTFNDIVRLFAG